MSTQWYVATTKPKAEEMCAGGLLEQGYEIYLPKKFTRHSDGRSVLAKPSLRFEGYLIVACDMALGEHGPINNTRGIGELLPPGDKPTSLPSYWVREMRAYEIMEFFRARSRKKPEPRNDLRPGDPVMIDKTDHLFHGARGELMKVENYIASVLVGMVIVKLPEIDLRKIEEEEEAGAAA